MEYAKDAWLINPVLLDCRHLLIITLDTERILEINGEKMKIVPVWKWLLNL